MAAHPHRRCSFPLDTRGSEMFSDRGVKKINKEIKYFAISLTAPDTAIRLPTPCQVASYKRKRHDSTFRKKKRREKFWEEKQKKKIRQVVQIRNAVSSLMRFKEHPVYHQSINIVVRQPYTRCSGISDVFFENVASFGNSLAFNGLTRRLVK